jgi:hypothetical protein
MRHKESYHQKLSCNGWQYMSLNIRNKLKRKEKQQAQDLLKEKLT